MRALLVLALCCALAAAEPRRAKGRSGGRKPNFKIVEDPSAVPQVSASEKDVSNREGKGMVFYISYENCKYKVSDPVFRKSFISRSSLAPSHWSRELSLIG